MLTLEKLREYAAGPERTALIRGEERLSYRELEARSDAFAAWLRERCGEDRSPVLLYGEKEPDFLCCLLGALKSGRAYVPVDRAVPPERAARIAAEVSPRAAVDFGGLPPGAAPLVLDAAGAGEVLSRPAPPAPREEWVSGEDWAYLLFTSGSTGEPKGVAVTAANLESFLSGVLPWYPPEEGGTILHQVSYSFDVSGCAVYAGLARGMALFTVEKALARDYRRLFDALGASGLTFWASTPSFAELCLASGRFRQELLPELRQFLFCGEVLTHALCDALAERFPLARVVNTYGPTEAAVLVTAEEVTPELRRDGRSIPIGRPIRGTALRLTDEAGREISADGVPGELCILGSSVGPGYFGRPDLTGKSFFTDEATGLRGYRTGDLCLREAGRYYYLGRKDNQLKLDGYRVEVEDVEANLQKLPNVARAAVVPVREGERVAWLAAFLLLREPDGLTPLKRSLRLKREAARFLPDYMIPRQLIAVDSFPLNLNGKIDKKALLRRLEEGAP